MVKFLILILNKSYFLTLRNNALIFVFFVIVMLELRGIVECALPSILSFKSVCRHLYVQKECLSTFYYHEKLVS